mgnify:CR=1 FL=1
MEDFRKKVFWGDMWTRFGSLIPIQKSKLMKLIKFFPLCLLPFLLISCNSLEDKYQVEKRYWDNEDYKNVVRELRFGIEPDEQIPSLSTPEKRVVFEKLVDEQNYTVVLDDEELGTKYKSEIASEFFERWKDMNKIYRATDRKDQYIYDRELVKVWHFGLGLQLRYFKLGNDLIQDNADDPNAGRVKRNMKSNISTLISNYNIYLDEINNEDAFSEEGKKLFSDGIENYFIKLIQQHPKADYSSMENKIDLMKKKSRSDMIIKSLNRVSERIQEEKSEQV